MIFVLKVTVVSVPQMAAPQLALAFVKIERTDAKRRDRSARADEGDLRLHATMMPPSPTPVRIGGRRVWKSV